jgi:Na+(H+)/acetate symporter ActP
MKEALKKVFDKSVLAVISVLVLFVVVFEYVVFPGLTVADTYVNILSAIVGLLTILFVYHFIQWRALFDYLFGKDEVVPPGETELDYLPKEGLVKKKRVYKKKKSTKKKVVDVEPTKPKAKSKK